jgi:Rieske Fe-S protein
MHVTGLTTGPHARVECENGLSVGAASIVVATNTPINDRAVIHTKQAPYTTYVVGLEIAREDLRPGLYWDTADPYHYVRVAPLPDGPDDRVLLIVGGEDHKTGQEQDKDARFDRLLNWTRRTLRLDGEVRFRWSGQVMETLDGLGHIGRNPMDHDNAYIITGDSGMGLTHGTLGAMIVSDLITGVVNPWRALYEPSRKPLGALKTFAEENLNVARQMSDWILPGDVGTRHEIERGTGAILRNGLHKEAVYCDETGATHRCSAVCPHLGCIVRWNAVEKIWDCPCHGSRFDRYGKVLTGPSRADLEPLGPSGD